MGESTQPASSPRSPPSPPGWPLLGHLPALGRDSLGFFTRCAREHGGVVALRMVRWPALLLTRPKDIEYVLVKNHRNFIKHRFAWRQFRAIFGNGLLVSEGDFWLRQRRLMASAFSGKRLASYGHVMVRLTREMLHDWRFGEVRDIHAEMMALTLRIAVRSLFNSEIEEDVAAVERAVDDLTRESVSRLKRPVLIPDWVPLPGHIRYRRGLRRIEEVVQRLIAERRARLDGEESDLLSTLMKAGDEDGQAMSDRQLRDEVITLLLAGHETTAVTLSWAFYLLARHPEVQERIAGEVATVLAERPGSPNDLLSLRGTESAVSEALRLYPPAWAFGREAVQDCEIGGYPIAAGTTIYLVPWVMHRDPRYFDAPDEFRPERWDGDLAQRLPRFAYFPFGGGPRVCIGNRFAIMEAVLILATVLQRFRVELEPGRPAEPLPSITLRPKSGVWVRLRDPAEPGSPTGRSPNSEFSPPATAPSGAAYRGNGGGRL